MSDTEQDQAANPRAWTNDPAIRLRNARRRAAIEEVYLPQPAPVWFPAGGRFNTLYAFAAEKIGQGAPLTYLEFGVWRGASIKRMTQLFTAPEARFVGFDSFQGLPEAWGDKAAGTFSTGGEMPRVTDGRVSLVKGYFQNTLPGFLSGHAYQQPMLVHFDADLYSSTLFLLTTLWHHVADYYFMFDEFPGDEAAALHDFAKAYPVKFEFYACTKRDEAAAVPVQVFGHMRRVEFAL